MRALTAAHEQSYGRPVDEQRQHRGRGQQQRESTRVRQYLLFGDRLVYDPFLRSGGAIGRGRRASGVPRGGPRGGRAINTCGRAIDTRGPARGLAVIYLRQAKEDLVLGYVADLIGDLCSRILDLILADVVLIGDLLDRLSRAHRRTRGGSRLTRSGARGSRLLHVAVIFLVVEVLVDEDDLYLAAVVGYNVRTTCGRTRGPCRGPRRSARCSGRACSACSRASRGGGCARGRSGRRSNGVLR